MNNYHPSLKHQVIVDRIRILSFRIHDRFPKSSLKEHSFNFVQFSKDFKVKIDNSKKWSKMFLIWQGALILITVVCSAVLMVHLIEVLPDSKLETLPILNAFFNMSFIFFSCFYFLFTVDRWYSRKRISELLIELKNYIHVADMHQINKDPNHFHDEYISAENSPTKSLTKFELQRYLDYTHEFISLSSKLSCLILDKFHDDQEIISSVNEVDLLCNGISSKIWQKIIVLNSIEE
jgi:hypothetical protein